MVDSHDGPPPDARPPQLADLLSLCRSLDRESGRYVVVGGMAMIQAGFVRATGGIDARIGAPGGTRTPDTQVRSLVLYPTELRARGRAARGAQPKRPAQVYTRLQGPDTDG